MHSPSDDPEGIERREDTQAYRANRTRANAYAQERKPPIGTEVVGLNGTGPMSARRIRPPSPATPPLRG